MPGPEFLDTFEQGPRRWRRGKRQIQRERVLVQSRLQRRVAEQRLDLRPEQQRAGRRCKVQRLDPDSVARKQQLTPPTVPQRKRKHAAQVVDTVRAVLLVQVDDDLRVSAGPKAVTPGLQSWPMRGVVVDLAVVDEPDRAVLVGHRLIARGQVDNAQAAKAKADLTIG